MLSNAPKDRHLTPEEIDGLPIGQQTALEFSIGGSHLKPYVNGHGIKREPVAEEIRELCQELGPEFFARPFPNEAMPEEIQA